MEWRQLNLLIDKEQRISFIFEGGREQLKMFHDVLKKALNLMFLCVRERAIDYT